MVQANTSLYYYTTKEPLRQLSHRHKAGQKRAQSCSKALEDEENKEVMIYDPEEGWDDSTETHGVVLDYDTQEEVRRSECCMFMRNTGTKANVYRNRVHCKNGFTKACVE